MKVINGVLTELCESDEKFFVKHPVEFWFGIHTIGKGVFSRFHISEITIPATVTKVEENAFVNNSSLRKVSFAGKKCEISKSAFKNTCINYIKLPEKINELSRYMFYYCRFLETVEGTENLTKIAKGAFKDCEKLKNFKFGYKLKQIDEDAFRGCNLLEQIKLPPTIEKVLSYAFAECKNLKSVDFGGTRILGEGVLTKDENLVSVYGCENLEEIPNYCFQNCNNLVDFNLGEKVNIIGINAFSNVSIENIKFSKNVQIIKSYAFENANIKSIDMSKSKIELLPNSAFYNCRNLESVKLPQTLTTIGYQALASCYMLKKLSLPASLKIIEMAAFNNCTAIQNFDFSKVDSINVLEDDVFLCTDADLIKIPFVKTIKSDAIDDKYHKFFNYDPISRRMIFSQKYMSGLYNQKNILKDKDFNPSALACMPEYTDEIMDIIIRSSIDYPLWFVKQMIDKGQQDVLVDKGVIKFFSKTYKEFEKKYDDYYEGQRAKNALFKIAYILGCFEKDSKTCQRATEFLRWNLENNKLTYDKLKNFVSIISENDKINFLQLSKNEFSPRFEYQYELDVNIAGCKFYPGFAELVYKNLDTFINRGNFFINAYNKYPVVLESYKSDKGSQRALLPTIDRLSTIIAGSAILSGVTKENKLYADEIFKYFPTQQKFDLAIRALGEYKTKNIKKSLLIKNIDDPQFDDKISAENKKNIFRAELLDKDSPLNFTLGKKNGIDSCASIGSNGSGIALSPFLTNENQNIVIKNADGEFVAKAIIYVNSKSGYALLNTIKIGGETSLKRNEKIYITLMNFVNKFATEYNIENPKSKIKTIACGTNSNDLSILLENNKRPSKLFKAFNYGLLGDGEYHYVGDALNDQVILWEKEK